VRIGSVAPRDNCRLAAYRSCRKLSRMPAVTPAQAYQPASPSAYTIAVLRLR
jgi:hypothetical protein